jgi:hypothetical protein
VGLVVTLVAGLEVGLGMRLEVVMWILGVRLEVLAMALEVMGVRREM